MSVVIPEVRAVHYPGPRGREASAQYVVLGPGSARVRAPAGMTSWNRSP